MTREAVLGWHSVGNCNYIGYWLLEYQAEHRLVITNIFQQKVCLKTIWIHPRRKHLHLIDDALMSEHNLKDVWDTRCQQQNVTSTVSSFAANISSTSNPKSKKEGALRKKSLMLTISSQMKWKLTSRQPFIRGLKTQASRKISHLKHFGKNFRPAFYRHLRKSLNSLQRRTNTGLMKEMWEFKNWNEGEINQSGQFSSNILSWKWSCVFCFVYRELQCKLREIKNEWWTNFDERTQQYADTRDIKGLYEALKVVYGSTYQVQSFMRYADS